VVHGKGLTFQVVQQLHPLSAFQVTHQGVLGVRGDNTHGAVSNQGRDIVESPVVAAVADEGYVRHGTTCGFSFFSCDANVTTAPRGFLSLLPERDHGVS